MVYQLPSADFGHRGSSRRLVLTAYWTREFARFGLQVDHAFESNPGRCGLPFEVEHGMNRLDLDPPVSLLHGLAYDLRVVSRRDDELVAILDIGIFKGYLALDLALFNWVAVHVVLLPIHRFQLRPGFRQIDLALKGWKLQLVNELRT